MNEPLQNVIETDGHRRNCQGRQYECTCGYDARLEASYTGLWAQIDRLRAALELLANLESKLGHIPEEAYYEQLAQEALDGIDIAREALSLAEDEVQK